MFSEALESKLTEYADNRKDLKDYYSYVSDKISNEESVGNYADYSAALIETQVKIKILDIEAYKDIYRDIKKTELPQSSVDTLNNIYEFRIENYRLINILSNLDQEMRTVFINFFDLTFVDNLSAEDKIKFGNIITSFEIYISNLGVITKEIIKTQIINDISSVKQKINSFIKNNTNDLNTLSTSSDYTLLVDDMDNIHISLSQYVSSGISATIVIAFCILPFILLNKSPNNKFSIDYTQQNIDILKITAIAWYVTKIKGCYIINNDGVYRLDGCSDWYNRSPIQGILNCSCNNSPTSPLNCSDPTETLRPYCIGPDTESSAAKCTTTSNQTLSQCKGMIGDQNGFLYYKYVDDSAMSLLSNLIILNKITSPQSKDYSLYIFLAIGIILLILIIIIMYKK